MSTKLFPALRCLVALSAVLATANAASAGGMGFGAAEVRIDADGLSEATTPTGPARYSRLGERRRGRAHRYVRRQPVRRHGWAGRRAFCEGNDAGYWRYAGSHRYRVSDVAESEGEAIVVPNERRVTIGRLASDCPSQSGGDAQWHRVRNSGKPACGHEHASDERGPSPRFGVTPVRADPASALERPSVALLLRSRREPLEYHDQPACDRDQRRPHRGSRGSDRLAMAESGRVVVNVTASPTSP